MTWPTDPTAWRILTVRPPWSWAIWMGEKRVENRSAGTSHRGPLMIHAGQQWSERGAKDPRVVDLWRRYFPDDPAPALGVRNVAGVMAPGYIGAVCRVADSHRQEPGCCDSAWAEDRYVDASGAVRTAIHHLVLVDVVQLDQPVAARGQLSVRRPDPEVVRLVLEELAVTAP